MPSDGGHFVVVATRRRTCPTASPSLPCHRLGVLKWWGYRLRQKTLHSSRLGFQSWFSLDSELRFKFGDCEFVSYLSLKPLVLIRSPIHWSLPVHRLALTQGYGRYVVLQSLRSDHVTKIWCVVVHSCYVVLGSWINRLSWLQWFCSWWQILLARWYLFWFLRSSELGQQGCIQTGNVRFHLT